MMNEKIKYKVLSLTYKSLKTGQPSYLRSVLSFPLHRCIRSSSLITCRLKMANRSYCYSAPVLWNYNPSDLRHVAHHVILSPILNSLVSDLSTSLFLKKLKTYLFHSSFKTATTPSEYITVQGVGSGLLVAKALT